MFIALTLLVLVRYLVVRAGIKPLDQTVAKWQRRVQAAQQDYIAGVRAPRRSWVQGSLAASGRRNAGLQAAISDGRIDRGIQAAGDAKWQTNTVAKASNWQQGVSNAGGKYSQAMGRVYSMINNARGTIESMPNDTFAARMARMTAYAQEMHNQSQAAKGGQG